MLFKKRNLYIITEQLGNSLYIQYIKNKNVVLSNEDLQKIVKEILVGLKFLKLNGIIHSDLKPENILLKTDCLKDGLKLIDFGTAIFIDDNDQKYTLQTLPYRAPEIILKADFDYKIDIWSLGCILYELITKKILFNFESEKKNFGKALSINKVFYYDFFKNIENLFFLEQGIPVLRNEATFDKHLNHFIIPKFSYSIENELMPICGDLDLIDFIKKCLIIDPNSRIGVEEASKHSFITKLFK